MEEEIWKDIPNYEGFYQVSSFGNVKSLKREINRGNNILPVQERLLRPANNVHGYYMVNLCKNGIQKTHKIHQLVAVTFLDHDINGMKSVVNHKDFNKLNNHVSNLEIVTQRENTSQKHLKSTSQYTGVCWDKHAKKWLSSIKIKGKSKHIGLFTSELEASRAYKKELNSMLAE